MTQLIRNVLELLKSINDRLDEQNRLAKENNALLQEIAKNTGGEV